LAIGCIVGVDIPLGKPVKDRGLDMEAALVFLPCRQDRVTLTATFRLILTIIPTNNSKPVINKYAS